MTTIKATTEDLAAARAECKIAYDELEATFDYSTYAAIEVERSQDGFEGYGAVMERLLFAIDREFGVDTDEHHKVLARLTRERAALMRSIREYVLARRVEPK